MNNQFSTTAQLTTHTMWHHGIVAVLRALFVFFIAPYAAAWELNHANSM